ncbi:hypothetical protein CA984_19885 [Streptosporangium minutum]|uniref:Uncharacterized protein n=1 Tax=Streptosporangium minutum TaxID=569862 RepID=A0A243RJR9_9ACTN|nr:hypothetical protein CA984_19885 [Streptosporangium minutum]
MILDLPQCSGFTKPAGDYTMSRSTDTPATGAPSVGLFLIRAIRAVIRSSQLGSDQCWADVGMSRCVLLLQCSLQCCPQPSSPVFGESVLGNGAPDRRSPQPWAEISQSQAIVRVTLPSYCGDLA